MANATPRRKQVALGLVGAGPFWDESYREAVNRQAQHVVIRSVYDVVAARADQLARERHALLAPSLTSLFERPDVDAVLVLETAWHGWYALDLAVRYRKPTLIVGPWRDEPKWLEQVYLSARDAGVLLMAALPRRHSPATNRLRELIATRLGSPKSIFAEVCWTEDESFERLIGLIDWCAAVMGRTPMGITAPFASQATATRQFTLQFSVPTATASLQWRRVEQRPGSEVLTVECQRGTARIVSETEIVWKVDSQETHDSLTSDRSSTEIILDQFCRRVVGGLVPVSDLGDVLRSVRLAETAWACWEAQT
jgi:predicted dehydrogenase